MKKKIIIIIGACILGLLLAVVLLISPIAKYLIEENSPQWLGRQITLEKLRVNIFNGSVSGTEISILEEDSTTEFIHIARLDARIKLIKAIKGKYDIRRVYLRRPVINIYQKGDAFNFDDIIAFFSSEPDTTDIKTESEPVEWNVSNIVLDSAIIDYGNFYPRSNITLLNLDISSDGIAWNDSSYHFETAMDLGSGGHLESDIDYDLLSGQYGLDIHASELSLAVLQPYLEDYMLIDSLGGLLSTDLLFNGSANESTALALSGNTILQDFILIDTLGEVVSSIESFTIETDSINTKQNIYSFKEVLMSGIFVKFAMYDDGMSTDRLLPDTDIDSSGIAPLEVVEYMNVFQMIASYVLDITKNYIVSNYSVQKLSVLNANIEYTDYTLEEKFKYNLDSLNILSNGINSSNEYIEIDIQSILNRSGRLTAELDVSTANYSNFNLNYSLNELLLSDINPYSTYYLAHPFMNGRVYYDNITTVLDGQLDSDNKITIKTIEVGKKQKSSTAVNLPIRLAVALLRDMDGNINLDIPVKGDLNDPKYKLGKIIWQTFKNIMLKATTAPFRLLAQAFGGKEDDFKDLRFSYMQRKMTDDQQKQLKKLSDVLKNKPDLNLEMIQVHNIQAEKEYMALYEAKRRYLDIPGEDSLSIENEQKIEALSNKDSLFNAFLDRKTGMYDVIMSPQEKAVHMIGRKKLDELVAIVMERRNAGIKRFFTDRQEIPDNRTRILNAQESHKLNIEAVPRYVINYFVDEGEATPSEPAQGPAERPNTSEEEDQ